jgi:signal transduction histidine kinase
VGARPAASETKGASIRAVIPALSWGIGALALLASVLLAVLTTVMRARSRELADALDHVRAAQHIELLLVTRASSNDPLRRSEDAGRLLGASDELGRTARGADDAQHVADVRSAIDRYLARDRDPGANGGDARRPELDAAIMATRRLYDTNLERARSAELDVARTDDVADLIGVGVAAALLVVLATAHVWQRRRVVRPMLDLSAAMERYAAGDHAARARVDGAAELGRMASTFNALAEALDEARREELRHVAAAVHDLRDPLAAVQLAIGFASPDRPLPPEKELRQIFDVIRRQVRVLSSTTNEVLDGATIEAGELALDIEECDARAVVEESVGLVASTWAKPIVASELPPPRTSVRWDRTRIRQVIETLLRTALKQATKDGSTRIHARAEGDRVLVFITAGEAALVEPREPFRRSAGARAASAYASPGVGLAAARTIVQAHGGRLEITPGRFTIELPVDARARPASRGR